MASIVIQFRLPKEETEFLRKRRIRPNEAARESLRRFVQALKFRESMEWIRRHPLPKGVNLVNAVRESRDELDERG